MLEEIDPELDKEYDIRMGDSREKHFKDVTEDDEDSSNIHSLGCDIDTK